ncbi:hypothetical protein LTR56_010526 [Elasticomyces elasticus]|nr:hypothetical protein LTR56_010526 [Elasticomyces elasticus]KAK3657942.1 hypothetical protein LTR22_009169 [Elasticomyces elasticus]
MVPRVRLPTSTTLRFPALLEPPLYRPFLDSFAKLPENKKALPSLEKDAVDCGYAELLRKRFKHDDSAVDKYLTEVSWAKTNSLLTKMLTSAAQSRTSTAQKQWDRIKGAHTKAFGASLSSADVSNLKLPSLGTDSRHLSGGGKPDEAWEKVSYKTFAEKLRKSNPDTDVTKDLTDDAFRYVVSSLTTLGKVSRQNDAIWWAGEDAEAMRRKRIG